MWATTMGFKVITFVLTLISYTTWVQANDIKNNLGIIGGHSVAIEDTPYVVALYQSGQAIGAGSIVHEQFILTSASIVAWSKTSFQVLVGSDHLSTGGHLIEVEQRLCHENFTNLTKLNDICLLKLTDPVILGPKIAKVELPDKDLQLKIGLIVNVTGWGEMEDGRVPDQLQQMQIPLLPYLQCRPLYPSMNNDKICASARGRDACWGDSGAPMTYNNVQIGVASLHYDEYCAEYPSVYTKVSKYVDWISTQISNNL